MWITIYVQIQNNAFEPKTTLANTSKTNTNNDKIEAFASVCTTLLTAVDDVRTIL
ncbi:MAG: hypothetical protein Q8L47_00950 [bacterium]|nr:hypothetical protein [bacterium]